MKYLILSICTIFIGFSSYAQDIDQTGSSVNFEISNFGLNTVEGSISNMLGSVDFDAENLELCRFDVCLDASSIDTDNTDRDEHLGKEDYFDVVNHQNICFYSENVIKVKDGYAVTGTLSMKGIEKLETINFSYSDNTFNGTLEVNRLDYGVGPSGGFMIGKTVEVSIITKLIAY